MLFIQRMNEATACLYNRIDNRYLAEDTVRISVDDSGFSLAYAPLREPQWRAYPPDVRFTPEELLQKMDAACFFAFWDDRLAGQAVAAANWNNLAMLWDIRVDIPYRGKGAGRALLDACAGWAREQGLKGLVAETQDSNPAACKFYQRSGFVLGGADRLLYTAIPDTRDHPPLQRESALFFYLLFD